MNIDYKKLRDELIEYGMPVPEFALVAKLDGIRFASKTRLHEAFLENNPLREDVAKQVQDLWDEIRSLQFEAYALGVTMKLNFSNGERVHTALMVRRDRMLRENEGE
jgi:hypothetical protein